jgi:hypothetical protein
MRSCQFVGCEKDAKHWFPPSESKRWVKGMWVCSSCYDKIASHFKECFNGIGTDGQISRVRKYINKYGLRL